MVIQGSKRAALRAAMREVRLVDRIRRLAWVVRLMMVVRCMIVCPRLRSER